jgi:hypothetical protein
MHLPIAASKGISDPLSPHLLLPDIHEHIL